eukprot:1147112-Pelagomonas_calceolata.AAC.1
MIDITIKHKHNLSNSTAAAMIREDVNDFGLGRPSICVEYHRCIASALTSSLEDPSARHSTVSLNLLTNQIAHLNNLSVGFLNKI